MVRATFTLPGLCVGSDKVVSITSKMMDITLMPVPAAVYDGRREALTQNLDLTELRESPREATVAMGDLQFLEQPGDSNVQHGESLPVGLLYKHTFSRFCPLRTKQSHTAREQLVELVRINYLSILVRAMKSRYLADPGTARRTSLSTDSPTARGRIFHSG